MSYDRFEVLTDVKRVSSLTEETLRQMFYDDVGSTAIVYIDGLEYYAEGISSDDPFHTDIEFTVDQDLPEEFTHGVGGSVVVEGDVQDWQLDADVVDVVPLNGEYTVRLNSPEVSILE